MSAAHHPLSLFAATGTDDASGRAGSVHRADSVHGRADSADGRTDNAGSRRGSLPGGRGDEDMQRDRAARAPLARPWVGLAAVNVASFAAYGLSIGDFGAAQWAAAAVVAAVSVAVGLSRPRDRDRVLRAAWIPGADDRNRVAELRALLLQARAALAGGACAGAAAEPEHSRHR